METENDDSIGVLRYRLKAVELSQRDALVRLTGLELWRSKVEDLIKTRAPDPSDSAPKDNKYNWAAIIIAALTALGLIAQALK